MLFAKKCSEGRELGAGKKRTNGFWCRDNEVERVVRRSSRFASEMADNISLGQNRRELARSKRSVTSCKARGEVIVEMRASEEVCVRFGRG